MKPIIQVEKLSKQYRIGAREEAYSTFRESLTSVVKAPFNRLRRNGNSDAEAIWALKDVSFEVQPGEVVGIIGRNGAGKSTLLKVLSRITEPTSGSIKLYGRVASLLEVGTGFHPELTGRENIYLNGAILGMARSEIARKFDEIVAFAEVEKFIDTPVKRYSSGMYLRLAFSVAAHLEPEILVVDEVLAVGDVAFQKKCLGKMGDVAREGRTVLFVSHNLGAVTQLCERVLWMENGQVRGDGPTHSQISPYLSSQATTSTTWVRTSGENDGAEVQMEEVQILNNSGTATEVVAFDESFQVAISYQVPQPLHSMAILLRLSDAQGNIILTTWDTDSTAADSVRERLYCSICTLPASLLKPGRYWLTLAAMVPGVKLCCYHDNILAFDISTAGYPLNLERAGIITPLLGWKVAPVMEAKSSEYSLANGISG